MFEYLELSNWEGKNTPIIITISPGVHCLVTSPFATMLNERGIFPLGIWSGVSWILISWYGKNFDALI